MAQGQVDPAILEAATLEVEREAHKTWEADVSSTEKSFGNIAKLDATNFRQWLFLVKTTLTKGQIWENHIEAPQGSHLMAVPGPVPNNNPHNALTLWRYQWNLRKYTEGRRVALMALTVTLTPPIFNAQQLHINAGDPAALYIQLKANASEATQNGVELIKMEVNRQKREGFDEAMRQYPNNPVLAFKTYTDAFQALQNRALLADPHFPAADITRALLDAPPPSLMTFADGLRVKMSTDSTPLPYSTVVKVLTEELQRLIAQHRWKYSPQSQPAPQIGLVTADPAEQKLATVELEKLRRQVEQAQDYILTLKRQIPCGHWNNRGECDKPQSCDYAHDLKYAPGTTRQRPEPARRARDRGRRGGGRRERGGGRPTGAPSANVTTDPGPYDFRQFGNVIIDDLSTPEPEVICVTNPAAAAKCPVTAFYRSVANQHRVPVVDPPPLQELPPMAMRVVPDNAATRTVENNRDAFITYTPNNGSIPAMMMNSAPAHVAGFGTVSYDLEFDTGIPGVPPRTHRIELPDVFHVPTSSFKLLSMSHMLARQGGYWVGNQNVIVIYDASDQPIACARLFRGLYYLRAVPRLHAPLVRQPGFDAALLHHPSRKVDARDFLPTPSWLLTMHYVFAHRAIGYLQRLARAGLVRLTHQQRKQLNAATHIRCEACAIAKAHSKNQSSEPAPVLPKAKPKAPPPPSATATDSEPQAVRVRLSAYKGAAAGDIAGPHPPSVPHHYSYKLVLVHLQTRISVLRLLRKRADVSTELPLAILALRELTGYPIDYLLTDNARELHALKEALAALGVAMHFTSPHESTLNPFPERRIKTINELSLASGLTSNTPVAHWPFLQVHSNETINNLPSDQEEMRAPYQLAHPTARQTRHNPLLPFGCAANYFTGDAGRKTDLPGKGRLGVYYGPCMSTMNAYYIRDLETGKILEFPRNAVLFDVRKFPLVPVPASSNAWVHKERDELVRLFAADSDLEPDLAAPKPLDVLPAEPPVPNPPVPLVAGSAPPNPVVPNSENQAAEPPHVLPHPAYDQLPAAQLPPDPQPGTEARRPQRTHLAKARSEQLDPGWSKKARPPITSAHAAMPTVLARQKRREAKRARRQERLRIRRDAAVAVEHRLGQDRQAQHAADLAMVTRLQDERDHTATTRPDVDWSLLATDPSVVDEVGVALLMEQQQRRASTNPRQRESRLQKIRERVAQLQNRPEPAPGDEPWSQEEIMTAGNPHAHYWKDAERKAVQNLLDKKAVEFVWVPRNNTGPGRIPVVPSMMVHKVKVDENGTFQRARSRICPLGNQLKNQMDLSKTNTFSGTPRVASYRYMLAHTVASPGRVLRSLDCCAAYLNAYLDEPILILLPTGLIDVAGDIIEPLIPARGPNDTNVLAMRALKSIEGLPMSGHNWVEKELIPFLLSIGGRRHATDPSLFSFTQQALATLRAGRPPPAVPPTLLHPAVHGDTPDTIPVDKPTAEEVLTVAVWTDNFTLSGSPEDNDTFRDALAAKYAITDDGAATLLLGARVHHDRDRGIVTLDQETVINGVIREVGLADANPVHSPLAAHLPPFDPSRTLSAEEERYVREYDFHHKLGLVQFVQRLSRFDATFATTYISRYASAPDRLACDALDHLFRYLKGTAHHRLVYCANMDAYNKYGAGAAPHRRHGLPFAAIFASQHPRFDPLDFYLMCDASWGSDKDHQLMKGRSIGGAAAMYRGALVWWLTEIQPTVALATAEAESMATTPAIKEIIWGRRTLRTLQGYPEGVDDLVALGPPTKLYIDNTAAQQFQENPRFYERVRHLWVRHFFTREAVAQLKAELVHVGTDIMLADIFTKPMHPSTLQWLRSACGLVPCVSVG